MSRANVRTNKMDLGEAQLAKRLHVASLPAVRKPAEQRLMGFADAWVLVGILATFCLLLAFGGR